MYIYIYTYVYIHISIRLEIHLSIYVNLHLYVGFVAVSNSSLMVTVVLFGSARPAMLLQVPAVRTRAWWKPLQLMRKRHPWCRSGVIVGEIPVMAIFIPGDSL